MTGRFDPMGFIRRVYPLYRTLVSEDMDETMRIVKGSVPNQDRFRMLEFPSGQQVWTWTVPKKYVVHEAYLEVDDGNRKWRVADFHKHALHLASYSVPVDRVFTFEEIKKHLYCNPERPEAIPWVFKYYDREWGFCLPYATYEQLPRDARYHAVIRSEFQTGTLKVGEYTIPGNSKEFMLLIGDVCHPLQVNDSISGTAVLLGVLDRLERKPRGHFGIRCLFLPETIGSIAYLANHEDVISSFRYGIFAEMLGTAETLLLQRTRQDNHVLDRMSRYVLNQETRGRFREGPYCSTLATNDEKVTNAPGVNIPTISLTRWPYPEYHTSDDCPDIIDREQLEEASRVVEGIINVVQENYYPRRRFRGPAFLSGLSLDLDWKSNRSLKRGLQEAMFHLEGDESILDIAQAAGVSFEDVKVFLDALASRGLIETQWAPWQRT
jgi:aminopeptidase-like protein